MRVRNKALFFLGLLLLTSPIASAASLTIGHPPTATSGDIVAITVFGDPMGSVNIGYQIEMFTSDGTLSVTSSVTPAPFTPNAFSGTCGIVSVNACIASNGSVSPFAQTFSGQQLATLALDTTGVTPGTTIIVAVASAGYDFFGVPKPLNQTIEISGPAVPALGPGASLALCALLLGSFVAVARRRTNRPVRSRSTHRAHPPRI